MKNPCLSSVLLTSLLLCSGASARQYSKLSKPAVVEFFSFYCGPCYLFNEQYQVVEAINRVLPSRITVTRYHVSAMGKFGPELSEAWAVATIKGFTDRIGPLMFTAVQREKTINSPDDIKAVFSKAGISPGEYDAARHSVMVRALMDRQEIAVRAFWVSGTLSVYVKGRYLIDNGGVKAIKPGGYSTAYTSLISALVCK